MEPISVISLLLNEARANTPLPPMSFTGSDRQDAWNLSVRAAYLDAKLLMRAIIYDVSLLTHPGTIERLLTFTVKPQ
jgi:hypothetical protein